MRASAPSSKGLRTAPEERADNAAYRFKARPKLAGAFKRFQGGVGLNDRSGESKTALVLEVLGDGKSLWKSQPVKALKDAEDFDLDVSGIHELTLVVDCPGDNASALALWVEPRLTR